MKNPLNYFRCLHCMKLPYLNDIFYAKIDDEGIVEACECDHCIDGDTRKEKTGGWIVCKRELDGWKVLDNEGKFTIEIIYND